MKNKGILIVLTSIVSLLCLYYLSFTFISRGIEKDADEFATVNGQINPSRRQAYLDSLYSSPAFSLVGIDYTYKEIKENEVKLGLDLVGGMHVTMEVSAADIVAALANNPNDAALKTALAKAELEGRTSNRPFVDLFSEAYKGTPGAKSLPLTFANKGNRGQIEFSSTEKEVLAYIRREVDGTIDRSFEILRTRIDKFGVTQPNIQQLKGTNRIQIELPGVDNPERVRKLLQGVAKLEFYEVWEDKDFGPYFGKLNEFLALQEKAGKLGDLAKDDTKGDTGTAQLASPDKGLTSLSSVNDSTTTDSAKRVLASETTPKDTSATAKLDSNANSSLLARLFIPMYGGLGANVKDTGKVNRLFARPDVQAIFPKNLRFIWAVKPVDLTNGGQAIAIYAIRKSRESAAPLEGSVIADARQDFSPTTGEPEVNMQMNATGARAWKRLTSQNIGKRIAIVLDDYVYSAPNVQGEIPNGNSSISGSFTVDEAKDLANILKAGKLPVQTRIVEEAVVGPTLGQESINQGLFSILAGFLTILIFMVAYYSNSGLIANLAVLLNMFLILGILVPIDAVLTLPGIAGIVLTIGMAVDANVLINERIKDELRAGLPEAEAIRKGYNAASVSILDANITTLLAGIVLFYFGSGPVQGFATTLIIGIITSLFTSIIITRMIAEWRLSRGKTLRVYTSYTKDLFKNVNYDFVGKRKIAYIFSTVFIGIGLASMVFRGFDYGVDFKGGWRYVVQTDKAVETEQIRNALQPSFNGYPEVKTIGGDGKIQITTDYMIDNEGENVAAEVESKLNEGMKKVGAGFTILSSSKVGPTVANDIKTKAIWSVTLAMLLIFAFIRIRFNKWQYALGAIIAVVHDTLVILTVFTLFKDIMPFSLEIDQNFIAAVLTIVGFSVNDTVVIFDRVREFFRDKDVAANPEAVVNKALNDTFSRTVVTSGTVFLVVLILLIFGGDTIRGLSFALLIGVITGTYSTIYIAIPFVVDAFKGRKSQEIEAPLTPVVTA